MTPEFATFHNALRILRSIDWREFADAVGDFYPSAAQRTAAWERFRDAPYDWFICAPTRQAEAIWAVVESRQPQRKGN
jgi:hypothetical protein